MIIQKLIDYLVYQYSKVKYRDILSMKEYLYQSTLVRGRFLLERAYIKRMVEMGFSIGYTAEFRSRPLFPHGLNGIFISGKSKIGKNCTIYQQVTIGSNLLIDSSHKGAPVIGDNVFIGAGAKIIGNVKVGNNCRIGANAVVAKSIPDNTVVVPQMRFIEKKEPLDNYYYVERKDGLWRYENAVFTKIIDTPVE